MREAPLSAGRCAVCQPGNLLVCMRYEIRALKRQLADVDKQLYDAETQYLREHLENGNLLTGWGPIMEANG
mgnify:CR=1 FL=1